MTKACTQCGRCCINPEFMERLAICGEDVSRWKAQGRQDILKNLGEESAWREPGPCPFVVQVSAAQYQCAIYDTRPLTCRDYPLAVGHMEFVGCEMLEPGDTDDVVARFMQRVGRAA